LRNALLRKGDFKPFAVERAVAFDVARVTAQGGFARDAATFRPA
jgi:hypothetical protein